MQQSIIDKPASYPLRLGGASRLGESFPSLQYAQ
jgi:hypothetical protein